jgi:Cys-tRNA synthase (O-phospho-L-seryl-tRNA:Cys-tRNA synthase)
MIDDDDDSQNFILRGRGKNVNEESTDLEENMYVDKMKRRVVQKQFIVMVCHMDTSYNEVTNATSITAHHYRYPTLINLLYVSTIPDLLIYVDGTNV